MHEHTVEFKIGELIGLWSIWEWFIWCLDKDFCMAALEYVYEIFTETQLQSAVTKSNQKITNKPAATFIYLI